MLVIGVCVWYSSWGVWLEYRVFRKSVHHDGRLCMSVECAFTSPVIIELDMLVMYCMQFVMSVPVVSMVSRYFLVLCICWLW